jgi:5-methylcytosine-specific restriction endonuclease McrA
MGKRTDESHTRTAEEEAVWQDIRRMVLARDCHRCRDCGESADRRILDVHHLVRRADGGRDEVSNCITLCDGCHGARHPRLQLALSRRMMERWALRLAGCKRLRSLSSRMRRCRREISVQRPVRRRAC